MTFLSSVITSSYYPFRPLTLQHSPHRPLGHLDRLIMLDYLPTALTQN